MNDNILGKRLKILRTEKDLTQEEFGKPYNLKKSTVSQYESGSSKPDDELKKRIAKDYDISLDWLMGISNVRNPYKNKSFIEKKELYTAPLTPKDERDIEKDIEKLTNDWSNIEGLSLSGEAVSEEALEAIKESIALAVRQAKLINKKYTPKKYRKDTKGDK